MTIFSLLIKKKHLFGLILNQLLPNIFSIRFLLPIDQLIVDGSHLLAGSLTKMAPSEGRHVNWSISDGTHTSLVLLHVVGWHALASYSQRRPVNVESQAHENKPTEFKQVEPTA